MLARSFLAVTERDFRIFINLSEFVTVFSGAEIQLQAKRDTVDLKTQRTAAVATSVGIFISIKKKHLVNESRISGLCGAARSKDQFNGRPR